MRYGALAGGGALIAATALSVYALTASYTLDPQIRNLAQLTPETATWFLSAESPAALRQLWLQSPAAQATRSSAAWNNLAQTPEMVRLSALLYFLELKSGTHLGWGFELLDEPVAAARLEKGELLFIARLNLSSRIGIKLLNAFKGKTISLPNESAFDKPPEPPRPDNQTEEDPAASEYVVKPEDSLPALIEKRESLRNLEISHIDLGGAGLYMTLLDDVLFASDSLDALEDSLQLAGDPEGASIAALPGMQSALAALAGRPSRALALLTPRAGLPGAVALFAGGDQGLAAVFELGDGRAPTADLYSIGASRFAAASAPTTGPAWAALLPADAPVAIYSRRDSLPELLALGKSAEGDPREMALAAERFFEKAGVNQTAWKQAGFALVFHGFTLHQDRLYPEASLGANVSSAELDRLRTALFGAGRIQSAAFQGVAYAKLVRAQRYYAPSVARVQTAKATPGAASFLSGNPAGLESIVAAAAGARPDLTDMAADAAANAYADAPLQIVVNLPAARRALRDLLLREGARSGRFTELTVDRDVLALFDIFGTYTRLHLSAGGTGTPAGKLHLSQSAP